MEKVSLKVNVLLASIITLLLLCNETSVLYCTEYVSLSNVIYGVIHEILTECGAVMTSILINLLGGIIAIKNKLIASSYVSI